MKIILAPNAFKLSMTARQAAAAMRRGLRRALPAAELIEMPVADGGDGTAEVLRAALGGRARRVTVTGPLGDPVQATATMLAGQPIPTCLIELAETSGLKLVPPARRNPMRTTSRGLGEIIIDARRRGAKRIVIGLGGSATVDGGAGMAQALGYRLLDPRGRPIGPGGAGLEKLARIVRPDSSDASLTDAPGFADGAKLKIEALCDVKNRLLGPRGAAAVFGPQKGATPAMVRRLEAGLEKMARRIEIDLTRNVRNIRSGGAAGGLGAALVAFAGAKLRPGAESVLELIGFDRALDGADWVMTGEGRLDMQTLDDKAPAVVARWASARGVPTIALAGEVRADFLARERRSSRPKFHGCFSFCPGPMSLEESKAAGPKLLEQSAYQLGRLLSGRRTGR